MAQKQLGAIQSNVTQFEFERPIIPGLTAMAALGHTPGHIAGRITSGDQSMVPVADTVHTHTINLWNPSWKPIFDTDPDLAAQTRQAVLAKIASDRTLMYAYHFPFPIIFPFLALAICDRAQSGDSTGNPFAGSLKFEAKL